MVGFKVPWSFYREQWTPYPPAPTGDYMKDKTVVITGATSGIGLESAKQLADASPRCLILAVRNVAAGQKILKDIQGTHPGLEGQVLYLDLSNLQSVRKFSEEMVQFGRIDLLINNAAINPGFEDGPIQMTDDGYEITFQTNVLAPFLLTCLLLPLLRSSTEPKILFVGSDTHAYAKSDTIQGALASEDRRRQTIIGAYNDPEIYATSTRYIESKLLLQMLTRSLIGPLTSIGMSVINVNPGLTMTNLNNSSEFKISISMVYMIFWFMSNARSAKIAARNITSASAWKGGSQDYWSSCVPTASENTWLYSGKGIKAVEVFFKEMIDEVEKISPGCTTTIQSK